MKPISLAHDVVIFNFVCDNGFIQKSSNRHKALLSSRTAFANALALFTNQGELSMRKRHWMLMPAVAAMLTLVGCASTPAPRTIADLAAATPELSTLSRLIGEAGLAETLRSAGPFTVFAPTDAAFKAVPAKTLDALAKDPAQLKAVLGYHVLPGKLMAADVKDGKVKTSQGSDLTLAKAGTFVTVEEALVTQADVLASNGVVHVIDRVLLPPAPKK
jgi:uncharacterized surface protein with fasciclin (FAS1) repeats